MTEVTGLAKFIAERTEGGKALGRRGLAKVAKANQGTLFVPAYDLECFMAGEIFNAGKDRYTLQEFVGTSEHVFVDRSYVPHSVRKLTQPAMRGRDEYVHDDEYARGIGKLLEKEASLRIDQLVGKGIVRGEAIAVLPAHDASAYHRETLDKYPYIIEEKQLQSEAEKSRALDTLGIRTPFILVSEIRAGAQGYRKTYTRDEFLATPAQRLKVRWSGDAGFQYSFKVYGIPWP